MTDLRKQARGCRMVNGEKRSETIKGTITYSALLRTDANAVRLGVARSRYVDMALEMLNDLVENGAAPTGAMEHWQQIAKGAQASLLSARDAIDCQVAALGVICMAAGAEIADAELVAETEADRRAA